MDLSRDKISTYFPVHFLFTYVMDLAIVKPQKMQKSVKDCLSQLNDILYHRRFEESVDHGWWDFCFCCDVEPYTLPPLSPLPPQFFATFLHLISFTESLLSM